MSRDRVDAEDPHENADRIRLALRRVEEHLERERRRIASEITSYPSPIPACDAQFNYLLEQRERVAQDLQLLATLTRTDLPGRDVVAHVVELLTRSPFVGAELEQSLREYSSEGAENPMTPTPTLASEADAIARTIQMYVDGGRSGRGDDMKAAFHPDATMFGYVGTDLFSGPIQKLFDWNDRNGPAAELHARIASVDIAETIATVRLELDNWSGRRFTDMFTLLKVDGEWKIISKVFYLHP
jgi:hypothetical protein